jgi:hypothetical protein
VRASAVIAPAHVVLQLSHASIEGIADRDVHVLVRVISYALATDDELGARHVQA